MRSAAIALSWVFHPLLLTTWLILCLGYFFPPILGIRPDVHLKFTLFVFLVTFVFPALNIALMLKLSGSDASLAMEKRSQRVIPFIFITLIYCFFTGLFLYKHTLGPNFNGLLKIISVLVLTGTVITFFFKVSIHSLAMAGLVGVMLDLNKLTGGFILYPTAGLIIIAGLVMSSRLYLSAHTLREVTVGAITGLVIGAGGMHFLFE